MTITTRAVSAAAILAVLLIAARAEARFGKSDSDDDVHEAVPVHAPSDCDDDDDDHHVVYDDRSAFGSSDDDDSSGSTMRAPRTQIYLFGWNHSYVPFFSPIESRMPPAGVAWFDRADTKINVNLVFSDHDQGGNLQLRLAFEGEHLGLALGGEIVAAQEPDSEEEDTIGIIGAHLSWALISSDHGRLRLEVGGELITAPDINFFGPDLGLSTAFGLVGLLGVEAAVHVTPWPHRKVDWLAGLNLGIGPLALRGGYRYLFLDDDGRVDGKRHTDTFAGVYIGVAFLIP